MRMIYVRAEGEVVAGKETEIVENIEKKRMKLTNVIKMDEEVKSKRLGSSVRLPKENVRAGNETGRHAKRIFKRNETMRRMKGWCKTYLRKK